MAIQDTFAFLNTDEFGTTCQIGGGTEFTGILDSPVEVIAGGMALSREYLLIAKTSDVSSATRGTTISVASEDYTVRENRPVDDGVFSELLLSKD
jgi:hypothetical protein